jgi:hypothetical protein
MRALRAPPRTNRGPWAQRWCHNTDRMRSATAAPVTSLLGSLGLHACAVLVLFVAVRKPLSTPELADAWQGNALEVDAIATTEAAPNLANAADSPTESTPNATPAEAQPAVPAEPPATAISTAAREAPAPPKPKPKPHQNPVAPASPASGAESAAEAGTGSHEATTAAATGAFGAQGLPMGVRSLPSAFARAIPPATGADPIWQTLPVGSQPPFTLMIRVDAEGHISEAKLLGSHDGQDAPPQFVHLRDRVVALLGGGLFALQNNSVAGSDLFRITITLSDRAVREESEPAELVERGFQPPHGKAAGRAYFTLASGRHFEAKVEVLGTPPRPAQP